MSQNSNNLLVIEDNTYIRKKIEDEVKKIGGIHNVLVSKSLKEAFTFLNNNNLNMITLDLSLPDGNGIEVLKWLKKNQLEKKVYVFSTSTELKQICLRYGAFAFFDKANDFDELIETIKHT